MVKKVLAYHKAHGRHTLLWRKTRDPYRILVSEMMLQQTQVGRVIPFYRAFLKRFPTAKALARVPLSEVLRTWSGLGYNRRAKFLHEAAKAVAKGFVVGVEKGAFDHGVTCKTGGLIYTKRLLGKSLYCLKIPATQGKPPDDPQETA